MKAQLSTAYWALAFGRRRVGLNFAGPTTYSPPYCKPQSQAHPEPHIVALKFKAEEGKGWVGGVALAAGRQAGPWGLVDPGGDGLVQEVEHVAALAAAAL